MTFSGPDRYIYDTEPRLSTRSEILMIDPESKVPEKLNLKVFKYGETKKLKNKNGNDFDLVEVYFLGADKTLPIKGSIPGDKNIEAFKKDCPVGTYLTVDFVPSKSFPEYFKMPPCPFQIPFNMSTTYTAIIEADE